MFSIFINRIIASIIIPLMMCQLSPVMQIKKIMYRPFDLVSVGEKLPECEGLHITAHRGVTAVAPENTIPAYQEAVRLGYYSAECDVRLTSDNQWVLSHGDDVNKRFWQIGKVSETSFEDIRTYTYKNGTEFWKYKDLKIPTLDEFLDVFVGSSTRPQIEIKIETYDLLYTVIDAVKAKGLEDSAIIISFDLEQLKAIHELDSKIELWYLVDEITEENTNEVKTLGDNVWLSANYEENNAESFAIAKNAGVGVSMWTVDSIDDVKSLYDMGVRYIETDELCY